MFIPRVGLAYGLDLISDDNRVWTLFDEALGPGMDHEIDSADAGYSRQLDHHRQGLMGDQLRFGASIDRAMPSQSQGKIGPISPRGTKVKKPLGALNYRERIIASISSGLQKRYPGVLKHAAAKLGMKQAKRLPGAAIDGPLPVIELGLILWGLYDIAGSAASVWQSATVRRQHR